MARLEARVTGDRPWHRAWPAHVPRALDPPQVPAWWLLERNVGRFGDRVAIRELDPATLAERRVVTYAELFRAARGAAAGLRAHGLPVGGRVAAGLPNGVQLVIAYYAAWLAGATIVPVNPLAHASEVEYQLADAGVSLVIAAADSPAAGVAERLKLPVVTTETFRTMEAAVPTPPPDCRPGDDVAVILYTGGTTGSPKGAMLTHRNLVVNTIQFAEWYAFAPGDETALAVIPMYHSGGMSGVMNVPLYAGATVITLPRFGAAAVAQAVTRQRVTRLFGVPTMFIALLDDPDGRAADYSRLRACRTNAAPLPPTVKARFDELVGREVLVEGYGLTETSPLTHANPLRRAKPGSIGIPLPETDARVVDLDTGRDAAPGQPGELWIHGPQVMQGYWNRSEETAQALADGWFRTGDVAVMDEDGYFAIVDRKKDVINTAGFKVWPREVEEALYRHPAVKLVAVIGVADAYRGEAVKACVVLKDGVAIGESELIEFCRGHLTAYKVPRLVELRAELPITATGKVLRRQLREAPAAGQRSA